MGWLTVISTEFCCRYHFPRQMRVGAITRMTLEQRFRPSGQRLLACVPACVRVRLLVLHPGCGFTVDSICVVALQFTTHAAAELSRSTCAVSCVVRVGEWLLGSRARMRKFRSELRDAVCACSQLNGSSRQLMASSGC